MNVKEHLRKKQLLPENLAVKVKELRDSNKTIATLNGSFDLLHAGHLHIIYEASKQADVLIVALNTDRSVRAYKDPKRPIIALENRMMMMAALGFVDYVTYFDEPDPIKLLQTIDPDVHVNGAEYGENCIEAAIVRQLHLVDLVPGLSTTNILEKIKTCV